MGSGHKKRYWNADPGPGRSEIYECESKTSPQLSPLTVIHIYRVYTLHHTEVDAYIVTVIESTTGGWELLTETIRRDFPLWPWP